MIKAVIIDDEPLAVSIVKDYLRDYKDVTVLEECSNGFEGVKAITEHQPDIVFLDVQMPKINGFEMLELIDEPPHIIFTTAFDEYALKAFEANTVDYLLKPFSKERFDKAMQKWMEKKAESNENVTKELIESVAKQPEEHLRVVVKQGSNIRILPVQEIHYFEAYDDYVKIHTADNTFLKKKTMAYFEKTLYTSGFVRVHRSFIVQLSQITRIEPMGKDSHVALLKSGVRVSLSKSGYSRLREVLGL